MKINIGDYIEVNQFTLDELKQFEQLWDGNVYDDAEESLCYGYDCDAGYGINAVGTLIAYSNCENNFTNNITQQFKQYLQEKNMNNTFDINTATVQEVCDYAVAKIVEQGGRCYNEDGDFCMYSDNKGKHCAVGWLLPEDDELMDFEGGVYTLVGDYPDKVPTLIANNIDAFGVLQSLHDADLSRFRKRNIEDLQQEGVDTSAPQYQQWVEMGA